MDIFGYINSKIVKIGYIFRQTGVLGIKEYENFKKTFLLITYLLSSNYENHLIL